MDPEQLRGLVDAFVQQIAEMLGAQMAKADGGDPMPEEEQQAMAQGIAAKAVELLSKDTGIIAAMKSEAKEQAQAAVKAALDLHLPALFEAGANAAYDKRLAREQAAMASAKAARQRYEANAPAPAKSDALGGVTNGGQPQQPRITGGDNLKYAHLDPEDMALAVHVALSTMPEYMRHRVKLGDLVEMGIFSDDFVRYAAHGVNDAIKALSPDPRSTLARKDVAAVKAALPFKANELNATDISNQGAEWLTIYYDTRLWDRARESTELFQLLEARGMRIADIPQGSKTMNVKLATGSGTVYTLSDEPDSVDATNRPEVAAKISPFTTDEVEESAATHILAQGVTFFLQEDSIIDVVQHLNEDMPQTLAESLEDALINGDKTTGASSNINKIDGTPGTGLSTPVYIAFDGLRHQWLVDNTAYGEDGLGAFDLEYFEDIIQLLPKPIRKRKSQLLFVIDDDVESKVRRDPLLLTRDVAGEKATLFTGPIPDLFGVKLYTSGFQNLANTAGKISDTADNNTTGSIQVIYPPYWQYGRKRAMSIETVRYPLEQSLVLVASVRHAFKARGAGAAAGKYNVGV